jgi:hypothetical protein
MRIFIFSMLVGFTQLFGDVVHAPQLNIIEEQIDQLDQNALVVFDVDYTLLVPNDLVLTPGGDNYLYKYLKNHRHLMTREHEDLLVSKAVQQSKVSLVDEHVLSLLEKLKQKNIKTIALTAMPSGPFGIIANGERWRIDQLASIGITLDWAFPEIGSMVVKGFEGKKTPPVFQEGILFSGKYPKGAVLCAFLKKMRCTPSQILFVDDRINFIHSVDSELEKENIPHTCYHYTTALDQYDYFDQKLADFQLDYLMQEGDWLSDEEAKSKLLNHCQLNLFHSK